MLCQKPLGQTTNPAAFPGKKTHPSQTRYMPFTSREHAVQLFLLSNLNRIMRADAECLCRRKEDHINYIVHMDIHIDFYALAVDHRAYGTSQDPATGETRPVEYLVHRSVSLVSLTLPQA